MNKVSNINLGGYPFTIDEEAYRILENYLLILHKHFSVSDGHQEIIGDIETRLAELLKEKMGTRSIVTTKDVEYAISVMGQPEDFGADSNNTGSSNQSFAGNKKSTTSGIHTGKKLFRDEDNKIVGGVCSGLAAFLGISDPLWVRLFFLLSFFTFGFGLLMYIVLVIIVPIAHTTSEKLEMRGEPINVDNIAKSVTDGANSLSEKISAFGQHANEKLNDPQTKQRASGVLASLVSAIGKILHGLILLIGPFAKVILAVVLGSFAVALGALLVGTFKAVPFFHFFTPGRTWLSVLGTANLFFIAAVPLIAIIAPLVRLLLKRKATANSYLYHTALWSFFTLNIISFIFIAVAFGEEFSHRTDTIQNVELKNPKTDNISLELNDTIYDMSNFQIGPLHMSDGDLISEAVRFNVEKAKDSLITVIKKVQSNGRNSTDAKSLAGAVEYKLETQANGSLRIPTSYRITRASNTRFRGQLVSVIVKLPVGKKITYNKGSFERLSYRHYNIGWDDDDRHYTNYYNDNDVVATYVMTESGELQLVK
jgi:phage shock protein PspC (stress-responsive transcriptional regulator)